MSIQVQHLEEVAAGVGGLTRTQVLFLRAYVQQPLGPGSQAWPTPGVMRRWMRSKQFRRAMESIREVQRMQAEMHLTASSVAAAQAMQDLITDVSIDPAVLDARTRHVTALTNVLRLTHVWQRFSTQHELRKLVLAKTHPRFRRRVSPYADADPALLAILNRTSSPRSETDEGTTRD